MIIPPILTCLIGRRLGEANNPLSSYLLRDLSASLIGLVSKKYAADSPLIKARIARTLLKNFLDPSKPLASHYGSVIGLQALGGADPADIVRKLILKNARMYSETIIQEQIIKEGTSRQQAEMVLNAIVAALKTLESDLMDGANGFGDINGDELRTKLVDQLGTLLAEKVCETQNPRLAKAILDGCI
jgi:transcription initiation factor TFIID subunit 6